MINANELNALLSKKIDDVLVSGFTECTPDYHVFYPMWRWVYIKVGAYYLRLATHDGNIGMDKVTHITCPFDIEEGDLFTVQSLIIHRSPSEYGVVGLIDLFVDHGGNLTQLGLLFDHTTDYILFDSIDFDGFVVQKTGRQLALDEMLSNPLVTKVTVSAQEEQAHT